jgi:hypothetical protein
MLRLSAESDHCTRRGDAHAATLLDDARNGLAALRAERDILRDALHQIIKNHGQWTNGMWAAHVAQAALTAQEKKA